MTTGVSFLAKHDAALPTRGELRRQLLALVLAAVLVWYTLVVPAHAGAPGRRRPTPDDEGLDGEVRKVDDSVPRGAAEPRPDDELDWPEFIFP